MVLSKKVLVIIIISLIVGSIIGYYIYTHRGRGLVIVTFESEKSSYNMGENVIIVAKVEAINIDHFDIVATSQYPNSDGIYLFYYPTFEELKKAFAMLHNSSSHITGILSDYYSVIHINITEKKIYKYVWNATVFYRGDGPDTSHYYRAPAGYYLLYLQFVQWWRIGDYDVKFVYNNKSYFYLGGINYTLKNSILYINSSQPLNFTGKLEIWQYHRTPPSKEYYKTIYFNYTGSGISINLSNYPEIYSVKREYVIYMYTPYGKYMVGYYESPGSNKS